jgi:hypothetical protein
LWNIFQFGLPNYGEKKLRFNWNTPIHMSPNEKGALYIGAQFLFRSRDHRQSWDRISPDLTTNDPEKQKQEESGGVTVHNSSVEMHTFAVDAIEGVRNAANARAAKLADKDPLKKQLQDLAAKCDDLRSKIVATKEGGMITGEERIRELFGRLCGEVNGYEGKPADYQAARSDSLAHELDEAIGDFQKLTQKALPA